MAGLRIYWPEIVGNILDTWPGGTYLGPRAIMRTATVVGRPQSGDQTSSAGRVPRERPEQWRRTLEQARGELAIMRRAGNAAERLTEDAERQINRLTNGRFRPDETKVRLVGARAQLMRAGRHTKAWSRYVNHTVACLVAAPHQEAEARPLMDAAFIDCTEVAGRLIAIAERLAAVTVHYQKITITEPCSGVFAALQRLYMPKHGLPPSDLRFDHEQHASTPSSPLCEGFRRVTRGRAPPRHRTARLHAVPAATERPVRLRSLS